jgi:hypothetical protein
LVLTNCNLFVEGVDVPALETCVLLRPTKSLSLYLQAVGRALRPAEGKTALILDHVGACAMHGMPDEEHVWTFPAQFSPLDYYLGDPAVCTLWITAGSNAYSLPLRFDGTGIYFTPTTQMSGISAGSTFSFTMLLILAPAA